MTKRLLVRNMTVEDIPEAVEVERKSWSPTCSDDYVFTADHLRSHLDVFPQGQFLARVWDDTRGCYAVAGFITTMLVNYDIEGHVPVTWDQLSDRGYITNHDPSGNLIFGVNLTGNPDYPRCGASDALMCRVIRMCVELPRAGVILGARMPSYHKYADSMSAEEYMWARRKSNKPLDPEIRMYESVGCEIITLVPGYMPDPDSLDNGVLMILRNPLKRYWKVPLLGKIVGPLIGGIIK